MNHILYYVVILMLINNVFMGWSPIKKVKRDYNYDETLSPEIKKISIRFQCSINVTWSCDECDILHLTKFVIDWTTSETEESAEVDNTIYNYVIGGLDAATNYTIYVSAIYNNDELQEYWSIYQKHETNIFDPPDVTSITVGSVSDTEMKLTWSTSENLEDCPVTYNISYEGEDAHSQGKFISGFQNSNETRSVLVGLTPDAKYTLTICSFFSDGRMGAPYSLDNIVICHSAPPRVEIFYPVNITSRSAILIWEPPDTYCPVFNYTMAGIGTVLWDDRNVTDAGTVLGTETFYQADDLVPWTIYSVCITATTGGGTSERTCTEFRTLQDEPGSPDNLTVVEGSITSKSFQIKWNEPEEKNGQLVRFKVKLNSDLKFYVAYEGPNDAYEVTFDNLWPGLEYVADVYAETFAGFGEPSSTSATTLDSVPPDENNLGLVLGIGIPIIVILIGVLLVSFYFRHEIMMRL